MNKWMLLIGWWMATFSWLMAQEGATSSELIKGHPFIQNYSPEDYNAFSQNWQIAQDNMGLVHVANNFGLLTFDGVRWRLQRTKGEKTIRCLAIGNEGKIFVGGKKALGYFKPDSISRLTYTSFLDLVPDSCHDFSLVYTILLSSHGVYFCSDRYLFRWVEEGPSDKGRIEVFAHQIDATLGFVVEDKVYIRVKGRGVCSLEGDSLQLIPGGDFFRDKRAKLFTTKSAKTKNM